MKRRRIGLLDIGLDNRFEAAMAFVYSTLVNINVDYEDPIVDIDFVRSRDPETVLAAFTASCDVLHVMAHGDSSETPMFFSSDEAVTFSLDELGEKAANRGKGICAKVVIADGCRTGTGIWHDAVRDCLHEDLVYIGTSSAVGWHESTTYCSAFYSALLRNKGKGCSVGQQVETAAGRAEEAYTLLTDRPCPYRIKFLKPSRFARSSLTQSAH